MSLLGRERCYGLWSRSSKDSAGPITNFEKSAWRGFTKAYRRAKRYVDRLAALNASVHDYRDVATHAEYVARLRDRHRRKSSFWLLCEEAGRVRGGTSTSISRVAS